MQNKKVLILRLIWTINFVRHAFSAPLYYRVDTITQIEYIPYVSKSYSIIIIT